MARALSEAERLRAHGVVFRLAQELHCTPKEAEAELARRTAHERWLEGDRRLRAKIDARPLRRAPAEPAERSEPWMMRD